MVGKPPAHDVSGAGQRLLPGKYNLIRCLSFLLHEVLNRGSPIVALLVVRVADGQRNPHPRGGTYDSAYLATESNTMVNMLLSVTRFATSKTPCNIPPVGLPEKRPRSSSASLRPLSRWLSLIPITSSMIPTSRFNFSSGTPDIVSAIWPEGQGPPIGGRLPCLIRATSGFS